MLIHRQFRRRPALPQLLHPGAFTRRRMSVGKPEARPRYHHSRNLTARCDRLPNQRPVIVTWGAPRELVLGFTTTAPTSSRKGSMISAFLMRRGNVSPRP